MTNISKLFSRLPFLLLIVILLNSCASKAYLTVFSQPEGAFITEKGTGQSFGTTPVVLQYEKENLLMNKTLDGCYLVKGFDARWVSGASASLEVIRLCGSNVGSYQITFNRDPLQPNLEKDLQFALQIQAIRIQQQQASAVQDSAAAALFSAWNTSQNTSLNCISTQMGDIISTNCN